MARKSSRTALYLVQRFAAQACGWEEGAILFPNQPSGENSAVPLVAFPDKPSAEAFCQEQERQARETIPIGAFLLSLRSEQAPELQEAIRSVGLPPLDLSGAGEPVVPEQWGPGGFTYTSAYFDYQKRIEGCVRAWWAAHAGDVTPSVNSRLWDAIFPQHRFYALVRVLLGD
jgi:hypothetical protein